MTFKTLGVLNKAAYPKKDKYIILTFDTHERYQTQLCKTGHNFYSFRYNDCKKWYTDYAKIPESYYILPETGMPTAVTFDFILSQSKFGQFQVASQLNDHLDVPVISLEHTLPLPHWGNDQLHQFKSMIGDINVFISEYSVGNWNMFCPSDVIHHSVDTNTFKPVEERKDRSPEVLSVVNDFKNRDYCCNYTGWQKVTEGFDTKLLGSSQDGSSRPAECVEDLVVEYNSAKVFLNTSTISPVPTSLLEAMACGCPVVTAATCMLPAIMKNGGNGFMSNDESELKEYIRKLLDDRELAIHMGNQARETVKEQFSEEKFINNWNNIFDKAYGVKK